MTPGDPTVTDTTGGGSTPVDWNGGNFVPDPKLIAGGATHTYVIVVPATVPAGSEDLECGAEPTPGHGFYNGVELMSGGQIEDAFDCGDVTESVVPTIAKSLVSGYPQQRADGKWVIRYDVTVSSTEPPGGRVQPVRQHRGLRRAASSSTRPRSSRLAGPDQPGLGLGWPRTRASSPT